MRRHPRWVALVVVGLMGCAGGMEGARTGEAEQRVQMQPPSAEEAEPGLAGARLERAPEARSGIVVRAEADPAPIERVVDPAQVHRVPGMRRHTITVDLRQADVHNVLRLLAREGGVNIVAGSEVQGEVTMRLRQVRVDEAFLVVLQSLGLGYERRGDVFHVAPRAQLARAEASPALGGRQGAGFR